MKSVSIREIRGLFFSLLAALGCAIINTNIKTLRV
jgi:hypothetical protein